MFVPNQETCIWFVKLKYIGGEKGKVQMCKVSLQGNIERVTLEE